MIVQVVVKYSAKVYTDITHLHHNELQYPTYNIYVDTVILKMAASICVIVGVAVLVVIIIVFVIVRRKVKQPYRVNT